MLAAVFEVALTLLAIDQFTLGWYLSLANALFGGTAEYVALWCKSIGAESGFYLYASVLSAGSFVIALTMKDTRRHSRILED